MLTRHSTWIAAADQPDRFCFLGGLWLRDNVVKHGRVIHV